MPSEQSRKWPGRSSGSNRGWISRDGRSLRGKCWRTRASSMRTPQQPEPALGDRPGDRTEDRWKVVRSLAEVERSDERDARAGGRLERRVRELRHSLPRQAERNDRDLSDIEAASR